MVGDLEKEVSEMLLALKQNENDRIKLEEELKQFKENGNSNKVDDHDTVNKLFVKTKENLESANEEKKKLKSDVEQLKNDFTKSENAKQKLEEELLELKSSLSMYIFEKNIISHFLFQLKFVYRNGQYKTR